MYFLTALSLGCLLSFPLFAQLKNPQEAFQKLMQGNQRYVDGKSIHPGQTVERREKLVGKQEPFAVIIGCSDSRVPPEIIFDQGIGDLFVVRVAGNVVGPIELDSIEYAAEILYSPFILVLGHQNCGAVRAVLSGEGYSEDIENISPFIEKAVKKAKSLPGDRLTNTIKANVQLMVDYLGSTPILKKLVKDGKLKIMGGYYELEEGKVVLLDTIGTSRTTQ